MDASTLVQDWPQSEAAWATDSCSVRELSPHDLTRADFVQQWDALAKEASDPNPYFESWYLNPSIAQFGANESLTFLAFEADNALVGLLPIARRLDYFGKPIPHLINWLHPNTFLGSPLVISGAEYAFWHALIEWADTNAGTAMFLHLEELALEIELHRTLEIVLAELGRDLAVVERHERAVLAANASSADYRLAHQSKKKRKDIRRRMGKLQESGEVAFHWHQDSTDVDSWIDNFLFIESSGWKGEAGSALACSPDTTALFRESINGAAKRGRVTRLALTLNGRPIAMLANFLCEHAAFGFKTAFDDAFSQFSPGILLEDEYINELDRGTFTWCDSCADPDHSLMNAIWGQRRSIGRVSIPIGGAVRRMLGNAVIHLEESRNAQDAAS